MNEFDKICRTVCTINFKDGDTYTVQEVVNKGYNPMYVINEGDSSGLELFSCDSERLSNMIDYLIKMHDINTKD